MIDIGRDGGWIGDCVAMGVSRVRADEMLTSARLFCQAVGIELRGYGVGVSSSPHLE